METWVRKACRQRAWRQLIAWAVVTVAIIAGNVAESTYWRNFFNGPYEISGDDLATITPGSSDREFVAATGQKIVDTQVQEITTETRNGVKERSYASANYYALAIDDRILIVKAKEQPPLHVTGQIEYGGSIARTILPDPSDDALRAKLYPVMLDTTENYRAAGYITIAVLLFYGWLLWRKALPAWKYTRDIALHPVVKRIEGLPDAIETMALAEQEMRGPPLYGSPSSGVLITKNFAVNKGFLSFNMFPLSHLLWAYRKDTQRYYYFIPTGKTIQAVLIFYGGSVSLAGKQDRANELLAYAAGHAPWAALGYTAELAKFFNKDTANFVAAIEARREQVELQLAMQEAAKPAPPPPPPMLPQSWPEP